MRGRVSSPSWLRGRRFRIAACSLLLFVTVGAASIRASAADRPPVARWTIPAVAALMGAAAVGWGVHLLTTHGPPSCERSPGPGCTNDASNTSRGAELTAAGAVLLLGSTTCFVQLWARPPDGALSGSAARGVALQGRF